MSRSRHNLSNYCLLAAALCLSAPAGAQEGLLPVHLRVAGHEVVCKTSPLADDSEIYVPLDALGAVGAQGRVNGRGDAVVVQHGSAHQTDELALARPEGRQMVALSDLARVLGATIVRTELIGPEGQPIPGSKGDTVYLLARLTGVFLQNGVLHVSTSFPISYHTHTVRDMMPARGIVDCVGACAPRDLNPAPLPPDERNATRLRAGQYSIDTARVVVELAPGARLPESDGVCGADCQIASSLTRTGGRRPGLATARPIPQGVGNGTEDAPPLPGDDDAPAQARGSLPSRDGTAVSRGSGLEVNGFGIQYDSDNRVEVKIQANGRISPTIHYLQDGSLAVDIPNAALNLSDPDQAAQRLTHPLLTGLTAEEIRQDPAVTRITLLTSRVAGFTASPMGDGVSIDLRLPRNATGALADKLIVVDPGHGGTSTGATAGSIQEKNIALAIALKLRDHLEACGARVVMTRDRDVNVDLSARPRLANAIKADLFVSVHNDSNGVPNSASGTSTYYHLSDPSCRAMAQCVHQAIMATSDLPSRGVLSDSVMYHSGFAVLRESAMPAILVEVAYINNRRDRLHLLDPEFQERIASAICKGLKTYVEGRPQTAMRDAAPTPSEDRETGDEEGTSSR